ncbi:MAG TPA: helix-turn-helix domain-containing protein [Rhizomicrobium sp.]|jgi:chromosomal replication initiation ATPase DnaA|nr:helix-turn-helix domain-containing protein [Rhizomicrobium sp.]
MARAIVAYAYGVTLEDMYGTTRGDPRTACARQVAMYLSRVVFRMTLCEVAAAFMRAPSTVCHATQHIEDMRDDPEFDRTLQYLETALRTAAGDAA